MDAAVRPICQMRTLGLAMLATTVVWTGSTTARAATMIVSSTADSGPGTLREALAGAADGDVIELPAKALFQMSTIVDEGANFMGPTATPMITSTVTIEANGSVLDWIGTDDARAFAVA